MDDTLGKRLRAARLAAGYESLRDAAQALQRVRVPDARAVSFPTIGEHESGETMPGADVLLCYAMAYGVSPVWLLTKRGEPSWSLNAESAHDDKRMRHYMDLIGKWLQRMAREGNMADLSALEFDKGRVEADELASENRRSERERRRNKAG